MIKPISALVLFALLAIPGYAGPNCKDLYSDYYTACNKEKDTCENLKKCQSVRKKCNQPVETMSGCVSFDACVGEEMAEESKRCMYTWYTDQNDHDKSHCDNRNTSSQIDIGYQCPGFETFLDKYDDKKVNCEGHKGRYWARHSSCQDAAKEFLRHCGNNIGVQGAKTPEVCDAALEQVSLAEAEDTNNTAIIDSKRHQTQATIEAYEDSWISNSSASSATANAR